MIELPRSTRTSQEAADAVGCALGQIAKSIIFRAARSDRAVLVLTSGANRVSPREVPKYSLMPLFLGTLKVTIIAMLFAVPLALAAAIYTAEFAPGWVREVIKPAVEMLAGFPSVVLGFFALIVLATWLQDAFDFDYRLNAVNSGIALALAVIPIVYTVCEDALGAVPRKLREASMALGATRAETTLRIVLPAALPGIFAGIVLGFGRAMGETMIVLMASGNAAITSWSFTESVRTVSASIAAELAEVVFGSPHYRVLFFLGLLLLSILLLKIPSSFPVPGLELDRLRLRFFLDELPSQVLHFQLPGKKF